MIEVLLLNIIGLRGSGLSILDPTGLTPRGLQLLIHFFNSVLDPFLAFLAGCCFPGVVLLEFRILHKALLYFSFKHLQYRAIIIIECGEFMLCIYFGTKLFLFV